MVDRTYTQTAQSHGLGLWFCDLCRASHMLCVHAQGAGLGCVMELGVHGNRRRRQHCPHFQSYRRKLLDGLVAPLALKPTVATQLLYSLKVTLIPQPKPHMAQPDYNLTPRLNLASDSGQPQPPHMHSSTAPCTTSVPQLHDPCRKYNM